MSKQSITPFVAVMAAMCVSVLAHAREDANIGTTYQPLELAPGSKSKGGARDTCMSGYVWREARPSDHVCVTPQTRAEVARQNRDAPRFWVNGAYGKHTCVQGLVWREAFKGDDVCVEPRVRDEARRDNELGAQRRAAVPPGNNPNRPAWHMHQFGPPNGGLVAYTITPSGHPACASYDGGNCLWGVRHEQLDMSRLKPLVCGEAHRARWGSTGYEDPKHWCSVARRLR